MSSEKVNLETPSSIFEDDPSIRTKLVRIIITDHNATDSDSSDEEVGEINNHQTTTRRKPKREILEINMNPPVLDSPSSSSSSLNHNNKIPTSSAATRHRNKFRGVRQRPWGKWVAEIRDPTQRKQRKRLWLGTFNSAEEAAAEYDRVAVSLRGPHAVTNFPILPAKMETQVPPPLNGGNYGLMMRRAWKMETHSKEVK
ncbi:hypothetical protein RYX36_030886 [Vicia faba]